MKTIHRPILAICSAFAILCGCATSPLQSPTEEDRRHTAAYIPASVDTLLEESDEFSEQTDIDSYLSIISRLLADRSLNASEKKLTAIDSENLSPRHWLLYRLLQGALLQAQKRFAEALTQYRDPELRMAVANASTTIQWQYALELAELTAASGDITESIQLLSSTQALPLNSEQLEKLYTPIWNQLIHLGGLKFHQLQRSVRKNTKLAGWIALATVVRNHNRALKQLSLDIESWTTDWPSHPGQKTATELNTALKKAVDMQPTLIALMLPLSGKLATSGKAVRDGFLAAYYAEPEKRHKPELLILDASRGQNIQTTYQTAVTAGAQLIIGPLTKGELQSLLDEPPDQPVTTLALNQITDRAPPPWLRQFALSPSQEITQIVKQALFHHPGNALVIYPNSPRGKQHRETLEYTWRAEYNQVVADIAYIEQREFSEQIKSALNINFSEKRSKELRRLIGTDSESIPRRRQDIDTIFLLSNRAKDARLLKPLLDFHYAGDLPIYATSAVFEGNISSGRDRDINNIRFVDMPWSFDDSIAEKQALKMSSLWQNDNSRLYALGADAWHIHNRLNLLDSHYSRGNTGTIKFDSSGAMQRNLTIGKFRKGKPVPLTISVPE